MVAQNKKLLKRPENTECINKLQLMPKMEKYTAVKMHGLQLNTELCESQKHTAEGIIDGCSFRTSVITLGGFGCLCSTSEPMKQHLTLLLLYVTHFKFYWYL